MNHFAQHLRTLPATRRVEMVHELIDLGVKRGGESLLGAINALRKEEREGLTILLGLPPIAYADTIEERGMRFVFLNPRPTSTPPARS
jgi:hypothetical protein